VPRSGPLPAFLPLVLSRIPKLVIAPLLLLVMPLVKVLPRTPVSEVGRLASFAVPWQRYLIGRADRRQRRISSCLISTESPRHNMHPELIVRPSLPGEMGSIHLDHPGTAAGRSMLADVLRGFICPTNGRLDRLQPCYGSESRQTGRLRRALPGLHLGCLDQAEKSNRPPCRRLPQSA
jgi:hypothetical protein